MGKGSGPLQVLWLTKGLGPGGAERLLVSLARVIDHSRFSCRAAYLLAEKDHMVDDLAAVGVPSVCLEGPRDLNPAWVGRLRRYVVDHRIDVVHIHAPYTAALARPILHSLGRSRPAVVYTEHNSWQGYRWPTRWANAATFPFDDARLAVSGDAWRSIWRRWQPGTEVVVHGIDLAAARAARSGRAHARAAWGVDPDTVVVGTVANLRLHKDYPTLLGAARHALDRDARVVFVAVGQGPLAASVGAEASRLGLGDRFRLLGYNPDPLSVLAGCDIFTLSSLAEGFPVALMEAMAVGVPVVATEVGGVAEAVRPGVEGLLVPPRRPDLLGDALVELAGDHHRRAAMADAAAARASMFDIRVAAARIQAIYERVTG